MVVIEGGTRLIVVTDLDGSLLDHHTYQWAAARAALNQLRRLAIPLIFNTSKTLAETAELQQTMGVEHPFIVENGAGVVIPVGYFNAVPADCVRLKAFYVKAFGPPYGDIRQTLSAMREREGFRFTGFGDMTGEEVARATGLTPQACQKAKQRLFSEPLLWHDADAALKSFTSILNKKGLRVTRGGRFVHVTGASDKGQAMDWLVDCYRRADSGSLDSGPRPQVMVLGDGNNDIAMLKRADSAVIIRSPVNPPPRWPGSEQALLTAACGPEGWNAAVQEKLVALSLIESTDRKG